MKHAAESPRRITGTEMEWGGMLPGPQEVSNLYQVQDIEIQPAVDRYLDKQAIARFGSVTNYFLGNGARFYKDVRERREYATPEDDSFIGTCANEIVNDTIMAGIAEEYEQIRTESLRRSGKSSDEIARINRQISFTKRVIDDDYVGCGYHISYSADARRMRIDEDDLALFGVFAATRSTVFGSGALLPFGDYAIGQKALTVDEDFSIDTVHTKPVVNLRKQSLADSNRFLRIHDTSADPNMSPWATRVKIGAGSIVLCMIEQGMTLPKLRFADKLHQVTTTIALDPQLQARFKLENGSSVTALEVQQKLIDQAKTLARRNLLNDEELWTLDEWEHAIHDLQIEPRRTINRIDWTMRLEVLKRLHDKKGWGWKSEELRYKDRQFSDVAIDGIGLALRDNIWAEHMPAEDVLKERLLSPPKTTRAYLRGKVIQHLQKDPPGGQASIDWNYIIINDDKFYLNNPFETEHYLMETRYAS